MTTYAVKATDKNSLSILGNSSSVQVFSPNLLTLTTAFILSELESVL